MSEITTQRLTLALEEGGVVSALWQRPATARACLVLAHGAGAGMEHPFMTAVAGELAQLGIASLRYQFPYMQRGSRRPDSPALCHATVRAAVLEAQGRAPDLPLVAGGKSFGGRMTSQAQADSPLPGVLGLVFLGFPLHPAGRPSAERAQHLFEVRIPMLFLQGTRDALAHADLLVPLIQRLGARARLHSVQDADHSFHVPARSGCSDVQVRQEMLQELDRWIGCLIAPDAKRA